MFVLKPQTVQCWDSSLSCYPANTPTSDLGPRPPRAASVWEVVAAGAQDQTSDPSPLPLPPGSCPGTGPQVVPWPDCPA